MTASSPVDPASVVTRLATFNDPDTRDFEKQSLELCRDFKLDVDQSLEPIVGNASLPEDVRFSAFFCLGTAMRRRHDTAKLVDLVETHGSLFKNRGMYQHLKAMAYTQRNSQGDLEIAIAAATRAKNLLPQHAGVLHSYAIVKLQDLEDRRGVQERITDERDRSTLEELTHALAHVLADEPHYGKFHATNARLQSLLGYHELARRSVLRAMSEEDSSGQDFPIRMVEYNQILARISLRESLMEFADNVSEADRRTTELRSEFERVTTHAQSSYLQLLGIFAAIIGLLITGVQVASNLKLGDGARLMLIVTGSIVMILSAVAVITDKSVRKITYLTAVGVVLIVAGVFVG